MEPGRGMRAPLALLCALLMSGAAWAGTRSESVSVQLQHITLQSSSGATVVTLSLSGRVAPHVFRLHAPERVVIDLPGTHRLAPLPAPPAGSVVTAMRSGRNGQQGLRLVLDLSSPTQLQQQVLPGAHWQLRIALQAGASPSPSPSNAGQVPQLTVHAAHAPS